jgi:redox-sensitive bicupin YhaK (pirin superfamily)
MSERIEASTANLGDGMVVRRALPTRHRRLVGAWCFLDHFGPAHVARTRGMRVGPHPHIGLQTVTWLLGGEVLHRDSLGSVQRIEPGALNLMTAGRGISHSEESPEPRSPQLHGVQFWIALPEAARHMHPAFQHYPRVPVVRHGGVEVTVLAGELLGERSPAAIHSPLVGASLALPAGARIDLPLREDFEYGVIATHGEAQVFAVGAASAATDLDGLSTVAAKAAPTGVPSAPGTLLYLGTGNTRLTLATGAAAAGLVLVGGEPLNEPVLLWWNFVARTKDELSRASRDWNDAAAYLGEVRGYDGPRLVAPLPPWADDAPAAQVAPYP